MNALSSRSAQTLVQSREPQLPHRLSTHSSLVLLVYVFRENEPSRCRFSLMTLAYLGGKDRFLRGRIGPFHASTYICFRSLISG